jgi:hypothetical protein
MRLGIALSAAVALLPVVLLDWLLALLLPAWLVHILAGLASALILLLAGLALQASSKRGV